MTRDDARTIILTDYPGGERAERVMALATTAKLCLAGETDLVPEDGLLLRAAIALDRLGDHELAETALVGVAVMFSPEFDAEQSEQTQALLAARLDGSVSAGARGKRVALLGYPIDLENPAERVLWLTNGAKHALVGGGCPMLADEVLLRASLALEELRDTMAAGSAVASIAIAFAPSHDDGPRRELLAALAERVCDPWASLAAAVANNRRLLGLDAERGE